MHNFYSGEDLANLAKAEEDLADLAKAETKVFLTRHKVRIGGLSRRSRQRDQDQ